MNSVLVLTYSLGVWSDFLILQERDEVAIPMWFWGAQLIITPMKRK